MSSGPSSGRGPRRPLVRQQDRPDVDETGGAAVGRTDYGGGTGGSGQDSGGGAGDRPQSSDSPARPDRCAYAYVQQSRAKRDDGKLDVDRRAERGGRPPSGFHRGARY